MRKLIRLLPILLFFCLFSSCYIGRFFIYNFADIRDYKKFPSDKLPQSVQPFEFKRSPVLYETLPDQYGNYNVDSLLKKTNTVAFLIIRNDSILCEKYSENFSEKSYVPSFSMSKSFVSALIGIAIDEGYIKSVNQPITDYLPELKRGGFKKITIEHLLNMRSGILYKENYFNPFGNVAKGYYGRNLLQQIKKLQIKEPPDRRFEYKSINSQLLGFIMERATGKKMADYMNEKIWQPLGMEFDATWSLDSRSHHEAKAFCCFNARARDFAKIGRLYLNNGNWNGKQIISEDWIKKSTTVNKTVKEEFYSYQWWLDQNWRPVQDSSKIDTLGNSNSGERKNEILSCDFYAQGFLGQFIYVCPLKKIIIVRLGKNNGGTNWVNLFYDLTLQL